MTADFNIGQQSDDFGQTEEIKSVRFDQENRQRVYVVTFERRDPFYVFELRSNQKPLILGELKLPGFSSYLHPYDQNTLIGIGRNAT